MKRILLLFLVSLLSIFTSYSQCTPDFLYTSLGIPGVYPPPIQIPNIPVPTGISEGNVGSNYNQTITVIVLQDTTLDVGSFLPAAAVAAMNLAGISTVMNVGVNYITFDVQGLPNGLSYQCDNSNCEYSSGSDGCIKLSGSPTSSGTFPFDVNMTINIQIPTIPGILPSMTVDIPSFTAVTYDLVINETTSLQNFSSYSEIYPNPTKNNITIKTDSPKQINIYNTIGKLILSEEIDGIYFFNTSKLNRGLYLIELSDRNSIENHKLFLQ